MIIQASGEKLTELVTALKAGEASLIDRRGNRRLQVLAYQIHYDTRAKTTSAIVWLY